MSSMMTHFSPFSESTFRVLSILAMGLDGQGSYTITASKKGLTLKFGKLRVCRGKDARELFENLDVLLAKAKAEKGKR